MGCCQRAFLANGKSETGLVLVKTSISPMTLSKDVIEAMLKGQFDGVME